MGFDLEEFNERCRSDLGFFYEHVAWPAINGEDAVFHKSQYAFDLIVDYLHAWVRAEIPNLIVNVAPRNGKSTLISMALPTWVWLSNPRADFLTTTAADDVLRDFYEKRKLILQDDIYRELNPDLTMTVDTIDRVQNQTGGCFHQWTMLCTRIGLGYNYGIVDDPNATNKADDKNHCNKVLKEFTAGTLSRRHNKDINNPSPTLIAQQRVSRMDLSGEMAERGFTVLSLPAIAEQPIIYTFPTTGKTWERPELDVLNPGLENLETLNALRVQIPNFQAQYQQNPQDTEGGMIDLENLGFYREPRKNYDQIIFSCDPASSTEKYACNWGTVILGSWIDEYGNKMLDLLYAQARKHEYPAGKEACKQLIDKWKPNSIIIEVKSSGIALAPELEIEYKNNRSMKIIRLVPKGKKEDRSIAALPFITSGQLRFPDLHYLPHCVWQSLVTYEILAFPKGATDDLMDAITQAINWYDGVKKVNLEEFYA
jgi:phage terminase large subunit-like protein